MVGGLVAHDGARVVDDGIERLQGIAHAAGAAGQVDDERAPAHARRAAGQRRARKTRQAQEPDPLGDPGRLALEHRARRFGSDVARRQSGAAGRQHDVGRVGVAPAREARGDRPGLVRHHRARDDRRHAPRPTPRCGPRRRPAGRRARRRPTR
jgi:hypothetical protein